MNRLQSLLVAGLASLAVGAAAEQAALDAACEAARQEKIAEDQAFLVEECIEKKFKKDRAACERFYSDHGNQAGGRAPLYYDLPECVEAFEQRKARR